MVTTRRKFNEWWQIPAIKIHRKKAARNNFLEYIKRINTFVEMSTKVILYYVQIYYCSFAHRTANIFASILANAQPRKLINGCIPWDDL